MKVATLIMFIMLCFLSVMVFAQTDEKPPDMSASDKADLEYTPDVSTPNFEQLKTKSQRDELLISKYAKLYDGCRFK